MNPESFGLGAFEVDCDGSACGSHTGARYVHVAQNGGEPWGRVPYRNGVALWDHIVPAGTEVAV